MVIEACRAVLTERCRLMCKQRGRQHCRGGAKERTFEPTNPSQDVARRRTLLRKNRGTATWTGRNATARDNLTRAATL